MFNEVGVYFFRISFKNMSNDTSLIILRFACAKNTGVLAIDKVYTMNVLQSLILIADTFVH